MQKDRIGNDVRILSHQIHRWIENAPNKKKIDSVTGANAWIIGYISDKTDNNEDVFQKDLEKCFEITRSTASKVVNLMVEKGLIERQSVPWDARLKKLVLTDRAKAVNKLMIEDFTEVETILSKGFSSISFFMEAARAFLVILASGTLHTVLSAAVGQISKSVPIIREQGKLCKNAATFSASLPSLRRHDPADNFFCLPDRPSTRFRPSFFSARSLTGAPARTSSLPPRPE